MVASSSVDSMKSVLKRPLSGPSHREVANDVALAECWECTTYLQMIKLQTTHMGFSVAHNIRNMHLRITCISQKLFTSVKIDDNSPMGFPIT